eukprot:4962674-Alexandrium_andersonii.AAC.1
MAVASAPCALQPGALQSCGWGWTLSAGLGRRPRRAVGAQQTTHSLARARCSSRRGMPVRRA